MILHLWIDREKPLMNGYAGNIKFRNSKKFKGLPSLCCEHPHIQEIKKNDRYYCGECGLEICSPEEFKRRSIN